jgi:hypothetical protein
MFDEIWILLYNDNRVKLINRCDTIYDTYTNCINKFININFYFSGQDPLIPNINYLYPYDVFKNDGKVPRKLQVQDNQGRQVDSNIYENYHPAIELKISSNDIYDLYKEVFDELYKIMTEEDSNINYVTSILINKPNKLSDAGVSNFFIPTRNNQNTNIIDTVHQQLDTILTNMRTAVNPNDSANINTQATTIETLINQTKTDYFSNNRQYINLEKISNLLKKFDYYKILPDGDEEELNEEDAKQNPSDYYEVQKIQSMML